MTLSGQAVHPGSLDEAFRLEAEPVSRLNSLKQRGFSGPLSTFYQLSCRGMTRISLASRIVTGWCALEGGSSRSSDTSASLAASVVFASARAMSTLVQVAFGIRPGPSLTQAF